MKAASEKAVVAKRKRSPAALSTDSSPSKSRPSLISLPVASRTRGDGAHWTFLTNHAHVLVVLSQNPTFVLREVALQVGITERAVQRIIADLESAGIIERERVGRQNRYRIRTKQPMRHATTSHRTIGDLLELINGGRE